MKLTWTGSEYLNDVDDDVYVIDFLFSGGSPYGSSAPAGNGNGASGAYNSGSRY